MASRPATRTALLLVSGAIAALACGRKAPGPRIDAVTPGNARNSSPVALQIEGANFYRSIVPDASSPGSSRIEPVRVVLTGPFPDVAGVTTSFDLVVSSALTPTSISASMPAGHAVGTYDLSVLADGGRATKEAALILGGPPVALKISSAAEATPGTADTVTLTASLFDVNGNPTSPDTSAITCSLAALSTGAVLATIPATVAIPIGSVDASFDITDRSVETFGVGCSNALSLTLTTGAASFIAGPPVAAKVLDASTIGSSTVNTSVVLRDLDGNLSSVHSTTYNIGFVENFVSATIACSSVTYAPVNAVMTNGNAVTPIAITCVGGSNVTYDVVPSDPATTLVGSSGRITFQ